MPDIEWIAAIVGGAAGFLLGALWYSPLMFLAAWRAELGITEESEGKATKQARLATGAALSIISALVLAIAIGPDPSLRYAIAAAIGVALAWIVPAFGIQYLFEGRSLRLLAINGGFHCAQFATIGLVLGLWP